MTSPTYRAVLNTPHMGSVFLGNLDSRTSAQLQSALAEIGIDTITSDVPPVRVASNPADALPVFSGDTDADTARKALAAVQKAQVDPLYPTVCSVGRPAHKRRLPEITRRELESVSLDEAVANLVFFMPKFASNFSTTAHALMRENRYISAADIEAFSAQDKSALRKARHKFVSDMLSDNVKLKKSKIPRNLGIESTRLSWMEDEDADKPSADVGKLSDADLFIECDIPGGVGLSLLPNSTLATDNPHTGERSYLTIISGTAVDTASFAADFARTPAAKSKKLRDDPTAYQAALQESLRITEASFALVKELTVETLTPFNSLRRTCCKDASVACITICLYSAGGRFNTRCDLLGQDIGNLPLDAMYNRMYTGFWHTAFMANPIYFIRILIEALASHIIDHKVELCKLNARRQAAGLRPYDGDELLRKLPPSVRLNVFSDYTWETICPALFDLFNGRTKFNGRTLGFVQFYDYTKTPGRWSRSTRDEIAQRFGIQDPLPQYSLPKNYHLTFSFSGTGPSAAQSLFASTYARQNSTVVFYTVDLASELIQKLKSNIDEITDPCLNSFARSASVFTDKLARALEDILGMQVKKTGSATRSLGGLDRQYKVRGGANLRVIDGDAYDLRHLDRHVCEALGEAAVIVGLRYKDPKNIRINVGSGYLVNPLTATAFGDFKTTATFSALRLGLGIDVTTASQAGSISKQFSLVLTPTEMSASGISRALGRFASESEITFATEAGESFGDADSVARVVEALNRVFSDVAIVQSI